MKLAVFDLDGTLLRSVGMDDACFDAALREVYGIERYDRDWSTYPDATDAGLSVEIPRRCGLDPTAAEHEGFRRRFLELIAESSRQDPSTCAPIEGIAPLLEALESLGWTAAIATGAWRESAETKLATGGLAPLVNRIGITLSTSDDDRRRVGIVRAAVRRASDRAGVEKFERVVALGDGLWDLRAAADLGLGFVGRCDEPEALLKAGASHAVTDYAEGPEAVAAMLDAAAVPTTDTLPA